MVHVYTNLKYEEIRIGEYDFMPLRKMGQKCAAIEQAVKQSGQGYLCTN